MKFASQFIVRPKGEFKLADCDPSSTAGLKNDRDTKKRLKRNTDRLSDLQYLLYAENSRALLIVLQAMDAGGKDGTIRHVMSGVNPQGCHVTSFKVPSAEEAAHDFLWRIHNAAPAAGQIGIFNRSHYEDVLVVRVHNLVPKSLWSKRYRQINAFEKLLADNGVHILKFFLHISKDEQKKRFLERLNNPRKNWKVNPADFDERRWWDDYMQAYETALRRCSSKHAPWFVIPSDKKWFRNLAISDIVVDTLEALDMKFPPPPENLSQISID